MVDSSLALWGKGKKGWAELGIANMTLKGGHC